MIKANPRDNGQITLTQLKTSANKTDSRNDSPYLISSQLKTRHVETGPHEQIGGGGGWLSEGPGQRCQNTRR